MKIFARSSVLFLVIGSMAAGCCDDASHRNVLQREAVDAKPGSGDIKSFKFTPEDCYDTSKKSTFALMWKSGKQDATVKLNDLEIVKFPAQTCDLVNQAVEALGDIVGGTVGDALGDVSCALHVFQGPDFEHDDQVLIQDLKKEKFEWQLFELSDGAVMDGENELSFTVKNSSEQCTGEDKRSATQMAYVLISEVDNVCDSKFRD